MLKQLQIRDLAVIAGVDLELEPGFTALTGETGAGKSILIDALALALGERGDSQAIRAGAPRLEVSAVFDVTAEARAWLAESGLDDEGAAGDDAGECILRRVVAADGRSRAWINGRPVPVQSLRDLGSRLVDICGQQAYQSLRHRTAQRQMLDASAGLEPLRSAFRDAYTAWRQAAGEEARLSEAIRDRDARREFLDFQVRELAALDLRSGEAAELEQESRLLQHHARLVAGLAAALALLHDEEGATLSTAHAARRELEALVGVDPELAAPLKLLEEAGIQLAEAADQIRQHLSRMDQDPDRESQVADRLAAIHDLARKHRVAAEELPALLERFRSELAQLDDAERATGELAARTAAAYRTLRDLATQLSAARGQAAARLSGQVTANMGQLGMKNGRFVIQVTPLPDDELGPEGADLVEFLVTTNPGQPVAPLARVASGGELSRLNLAIQVATMAGSGIPTLVFDEVDAGVGGAVAEIVGRKLRELAERHQVLCITHLPQVASLAHHHATIAKTVRKTAAGSVTVTTVTPLDPAARVEETARMLGGLRITEQTRAHAREMLAAAGRPLRRRSTAKT